MVEMYFEIKRSSQYRLTMQDLPVAELPMVIILRRISFAFFIGTSATAWLFVDLWREGGVPVEDRRRRFLAASDPRELIQFFKFGNTGASGDVRVVENGDSLTNAFLKLGDVERVRNKWRTISLK